MEKQIFSLSDDEKSAESSITHQSPSHEINHLRSKKNEPRMIVLALCAPTQIIKNYNKPKKSAKINYRKKERTTTAVSVFKFTDLSCCRCCCDHIIAKKFGRLRLSGCAVISKGILVVEGETSSIKRFSKLMRLDHHKPDSRVKVIWQGKVCRPSFGKFSILRHCSNDFAVCKFFADHGASHYWDLVVKSNCC